MTKVWLHEYEYEMATPPPEPFAVGDFVEWPMFPIDRTGTRTTVDSEMIETPIDSLAAEVSITEGKARRDPVTRADWRRLQPERDDVQFVGYLVTLKP